MTRRTLLPVELRGRGIQLSQPRMVFVAGIHEERDHHKKRVAKKRPNPKELSPMKLEILRWISLGKTPVDISTIMDIKRNALYQHVHIILNVLGAATPANAVGIALRRKLIE